MTPLISNKQLALGIWAGHPISTKTMRRERQRWGLKAKDVDGNTPLFDPEEVEAAKKRRLEARLAQID